jgi:hypothetical protein
MFMRFFDRCRPRLDALHFHRRQRPETRVQNEFFILLLLLFTP